MTLDVVDLFVNMSELIVYFQYLVVAAMCLNLCILEKSFLVRL